MNILITGASQGIGFEVSKKLADEGHSIIAIARNTSKLEELQQNNPASISIIPCDITEKQSVNELVNYIQSNDIKIDRILNNAGLLKHNSFNEFDEQSARDIFEVNFFAPAFLIQTLLPFMNKQSHIVNISSMGGFQGSAKFAGLSFYSASKAAIANLSECLAEELKEKTISVNSLALGAVQTEMLSKAFPGYEAPIDAKSMADFISSFCLNGHQFFNGKCLPVSLSTP